MTEDLDDMDGRQLIDALRGGRGTKCDWCGRDCPPEDIYPEEAGMWICIRCMRKDKEFWNSHGQLD